MQTRRAGAISGPRLDQGPSRFLTLSFPRTPQLDWALPQLVRISQRNGLPGHSAYSAFPVLDSGLERGVSFRVRMCPFLCLKRTPGVVPQAPKLQFSPSSKSLPQTGPCFRKQHGREAVGDDILPAGGRVSTPRRPRRRGGGA